MTRTDWLKVYYFLLGALGYIFAGVMFATYNFFFAWLAIVFTTIIISPAVNFDKND